MRIQIRSHTETGGVMLAALGVVLMVAVLGACLVQLSSTITRRQVMGIDNKRAFYLAEAGLSEAVFGILHGKTGNVATKTVPAGFGRGVFWVEATFLENGRTQLKSTGACGVGRTSLQIVVERTKLSVASLGLFGDQSVKIKPGGFVDSYDSRNGPYSVPTSPNVGARVGCNGSVTISGNSRKTTKLYGDVTPGPKSSVSSTTYVTITGSTAPMAEPVGLPTIIVPVVTSQGDLTHTGSTARVLTGAQCFDTLRIASAAKVVLQGPLVLVVDRLMVDPTAELRFDASGGDITLIATDALWLTTGSKVTTATQDPAKVSVQIAGSELIDRNGDGVKDAPLIVGATGDFYGNLYAPQTGLSLPATMQVFGGVTAQSVTLEESAKVHFDRALLELARANDSDPSLIAWRVVELPNTPLVTLRLDPLAILKVQSVVPAAPAAAHESVDFKIQYIGVDGKQHTWEGSEAKFNWGLVNVATRVLRPVDAGFLAGL